MTKLKRTLSILSALFLLLIVWVGSVFYVKIKSTDRLADSWVFKENRFGPVVGDLGGLEISIPPRVARFVEYEGDPHFLEPRQGPTPARTSHSKFRSFGFEVRFPDKLLLSPETEKEKRLSNRYNTMWLTVGVDVKPYNNALGLKRQVDAIPLNIWDAIHQPGDPPGIWKDKHGYKRSVNKLYGLVVDEVYGYSATSRHKFPGVDMGDKNIYHHLDTKRQVDALIKCHNVKHDAALCEHSFALPYVENTLITVDYRIGLLPQWREIQDTVAQVILGFAVNSNEALQSVVHKPST